MQRHDRRRIYDLFYGKPAPPVRRATASRCRSACSPTARPRRRSTRRRSRASCVPALKAGGYQAVAVCLLNAYANPAHEQRRGGADRRGAARRARHLLHEVAREFREYERASTTPLSAYVQPVIDGYLAALREQARRRAASRAASASCSRTAGACPPRRCARAPSPRSSPARPPAWSARSARPRARATATSSPSTWAAPPPTSAWSRTASRRSPPRREIDGLPIRTPVLDIVTVGAGGGSIVWVDDGGMLRVGPQSAGADPGPACYGRGGTRARPSPTRMS